MGRRKGKEIALPTSAPPDLPRRRVTTTMLGEALHFSQNPESDTCMEHPQSLNQREMVLLHFTSLGEVQLQTVPTPHVYQSGNGVIDKETTMKKKTLVARARHMKAQPTTTKVKRPKSAKGSSAPCRGHATRVTTLGRGSGGRLHKEGANRKSTCMGGVVNTCPAIQPGAFSPRKTRAMTKDEGALREVLDTLQHLEEAHSWVEDLEDEGCLLGGEDQLAPELQHSVYSMSAGGHNTLGPLNAHEVYGDSMNTVDLFPNFSNANFLLASRQNSNNNALSTGGSMDSTCPQPQQATRAGLLVKASSHWLQAHSFHTNETPVVVTSWIIAEYLEHQTGVPMLIVGFGGEENEVHILEEHVRFELTAEEAWQQAHAPSLQRTIGGGETNHVAAVGGEISGFGVVGTMMTPALDNARILRALFGKKDPNACGSQYNRHGFSGIQRPGSSISRGLVFGAPIDPSDLSNILQKPRVAFVASEASDSWPRGSSDTILVGSSSLVQVDKGHDVRQEKDKGLFNQEITELEAVGTQDSTAATPFPKESYLTPRKCACKNQHRAGRRTC